MYKLLFFLFSIKLYARFNIFKSYDKLGNFQDKEKKIRVILTKKNDPTEPKNYRPASVLPVV